MVNWQHGNMACLFTTSGSAARQFRHEVRAGNIGINLGVAAPMAYFPFSGWKDSFFDDSWSGGCGRVVHAEEGRRRTLVERVVARF
jgi:acyl-CoA reductase-like NAD-dependent aldehyde dehydrogenase